MLVTDIGHQCGTVTEASLLTGLRHDQPFLFFWMTAQAIWVNGEIQLGDKRGYELFKTETENKITPHGLKSEITPGCFKSLI